MTSQVFRSSWFLTSLFFTLVTIGIGCSSSDTGEKPAKGGGDANAQNAGAEAAQPATAAAATEAPKEEAKGRRANRKNAELEDVVAKVKEKQEKGGDKAAAKPAAPTKLSSQNPAEWKIDDLKVALNAKDPRYSAAVAMQGAKSQGDAAAGAGLSELLASVAKLPADGSATTSAAKKATGRKRSSKRGGDDEAEAAAAPPAATTPPPAIAPAVLPPGGSPATRPGFKLNLTREEDSQ